MINDQIFQNHIKKVVGLENTEAKVLINEYRKARIAIRNQLLITQDNTFTEARLKTTLLQLESGIRVLEQRIKEGLQNSFDFMYEQGVEDSVKEVNYMEKSFTGVNQLVPLEEILVSTNPNNMLLNNYKSSMKSYNEDLRKNFQHTLTQGLIQRKTHTQIVNDIMINFSESEWKMHRIVRTELHNIYNVSKMDGMSSIKEQFVPDLKKRLVHPMDERTGEDSVELAKKNPIIDINKPFKQRYNGKNFVFMAPPQRPNDRAILIPYRDSYDKDK